MRHVLVAALGVGLLAGAIGLGVVGCSAQVQVAMDNTKDAIDSLLGKLNVTHKEVQNNIAALKEAAKKIRSAKIKHQVLLQQMDDRIEPWIEQQKETKATMEKVQAALKEGTSVSLGGKTFTVEQVNKAGQELISTYKKLDNQIKSAQLTRPNLEKNMVQLDKQYASHMEQIEQLEAALKQVEADMITAKAYQEAAAAMGAPDSSLAQNVENAKDKLADLKTQVNTVLLENSAEFNEADNSKAESEAQQVINSLKEPTDVAAEMEAILSGK